MYDFCFTPGTTGNILEPGMSQMMMYGGNPYMYGGYGGYGGYYNTNYLRGITMPQGLYRDIYSSPKIDQARNVSGFKNGLLATVAIVGGSIVLGKFGKLFKSIGKAFSRTPRVP